MDSVSAFSPLVSLLNPFGSKSKWGETQMHIVHSSVRRHLIFIRRRRQEPIYGSLHFHCPLRWTRLLVSLFVDVEEGMYGEHSASSIPLGSHQESYDTHTQEEWTGESADGERESIKKSLPDLNKKWLERIRNSLQTFTLRMLLLTNWGFSSQFDEFE